MERRLCDVLRGLGSLTARVIFGRAEAGQVGRNEYNNAIRSIVLATLQSYRCPASRV
jgi:hypothetical protein